MPIFRKNLRYSYRALPESRIGKRPSHVDRHILFSKEPHKERSFILDGRKEIIFDVSKEDTRTSGHVDIDNEKLNKTRYINTNGKIERNNAIKLDVHTHPGENRTQALPSFPDIRGSYIRLIQNHLYNGYDQRSKQYFGSKKSMIVGYDTANKRISGRTIISISDSITDNWLKKYSLSSVVKDSITINENGKYSSISTNKFENELEAQYDNLTKKIKEKRDAAVDRYKSTHKNATQKELSALFFQEHFHYIQKYLGIEVKFQAEPGYRLNTNDFHFEKI